MGLGNPLRHLPRSNIVDTGPPVAPIGSTSIRSPSISCGPRLRLSSAGSGMSSTSTSLFILLLSFDGRQSSLGGRSYDFPCPIGLLLVSAGIQQIPQSFKTCTIARARTTGKTKGTSAQASDRVTVVVSLNSGVTVRTGLSIFVQPKARFGVGLFFRHGSGCSASTSTS